jgi:AGZA family xanthine/uracil permease-like MFS transporter
MGVSWQTALAAVFIDGIIFLIISLLPIRERIMRSIPLCLKLGISVGIGLFIAFIGLINAGIVVQNPSTTVAMGDLTAPTALLAIFGLCLMALLSALKVKGALLFGILATTLLGWVFGIPARPQSIGDIVALPDFSALSSTFLQMDFAGAVQLGLVWVVITFTFVDMFDTLGTTTGLATKLNIIDDRGSFRGARETFITDSIGTIIGAILGTSTVTTYVESASGVAEGGKTGLTSIVTGIAFLSTLFLVPFAKLVPGAATAPALIMVGLFMMEPVLKIDLKDVTNALPAFLTIIAIPFTYSISNGLMLGIISYTVLKLLTGRRKEISGTMMALTIVFVIYILYPLMF